MRPQTRLKSSISGIAAMLTPAFINEALKRDTPLPPEIQTELEAARKAHFPRPQARPAHIHWSGACGRAPTPVIQMRSEPHVVNGKQHVCKAYILVDPENPDSAKKLVSMPVMLHRGIDRKALKKALYNDKRLAKGRWVN